jgi:hypothetical protein
MTEHCPDHSKLMQDVGEIKGMVNTLVDGQSEFREAIDGVKKQLNSQDKESAVDRMKIKPLFMAIGIIMVILVTKLGETVWDLILKAIK